MNSIRSIRSFGLFSGSKESLGGILSNADRFDSRQRRHVSETDFGENVFIQFPQ